MSTSADDLAAQPFVVRFRAYLAERFPLPAYTTLISLFFVTGYFVAQATEQPDDLIVGPRMLAGFAVVLLAFLVLRFLDEFKDYELDREIHPERLVSRGVIRLGELGLMAGASAAAMLALSLPLGLAALEWCGAILFMLVLLWREFFIGKLLSRSYAIYAAAHQLLHPALVGFCFACWAMPLGRTLVAGALYSLFAAFSFLAFDVGRKLLPPGLEREGYETYSARYGMRAAAWLGIGLLLLGSIALAALAVMLDAAPWIHGGILLAWLLSAWGFVAFLRNPSKRRSAKLKDFASINMLLGFLLLTVELATRYGLAFTGSW